MITALNQDQESKALKALLTRPESLSAHFPFDEVMEKERVFVNRDGSLGVVFSIKLAEHEAMTESAVLSAVASLKAWFSLPENAVMQVIFEQMPLSTLDPRFSEWKAAHDSGHQVSAMLFEKRLETIKNGSVGGVVPLDRRAFLTIRWFPIGRNTSGFKSFHSDPNETLNEQAKKASGDVLEFLQLVRSFESSSQVELTRLGGGDLLNVLRRFFNPVSYYQRSFSAYNQAQSLSEQIVYSSPTLTFDSIEREGTKSRTLSLKTSPSLAFPGGMAYFTQLGFPMRIALNFSFPSKAKVKKFFDIKEFFLKTLQARGRKDKRPRFLTCRIVWSWMTGVFI